MALLIVCAAGAPARAADVLTQRNDNNRSGVNTAEATLVPSMVKPETFGRLWTLYVDGHVLAQPLYVSKLAIDTSNKPGTPPVKGTFNTVIVATMHNTIYAYDADQENRLPDGKTKPLWATWLGQPRPGGKDIDMFSTNDPEWGIASTPVIDAQKTTLWVVAWHSDNGVFCYRLHVLNLRDGSVKMNAVQVGGPPANPAKPCAYSDGFNPCTQKQRTGLLLLNGVVYFAFGGDGNRGNVLAYDAATLQQRGFWSSTPSGASGGIWQSGHGLAADDGGNVYLMTGNGTFDAGQGNFGDSFVKLHLENGKLVLKDFFTPCNQKRLDQADLDLGSAGVVLIPGTDLLFGGGKQGIVYLVSRTNMGKFQASTTLAPMDCLNKNIVQQLQATEPGVEDGVTDFGNIHSSPVYFKATDKARVYVWGELNRLRAFAFQGGKFADQAPQQSAYRPPDGMPGGMLAVSSNGPKRGIVWAAVPFNGDANKFRGVQGIVVAVDAQDVSRQLWTSELAGARDRLGLFASFVPPTVAGGKVFVATYGDAEPQHQYGGNERPPRPPAHLYVSVYGLLKNVKPKPVVNQESDDVTVTKAVATAALALDTSTCDAATGGAVDCSAALAKKAGAPAFHAVIVPAGFNFTGCKLLRVTTASKQGGVGDATGIGWYAADATAASLAVDAGKLVLKNQLKQVGTARFKTGDPAVLYEFAGIAGCPAGAGALDKLFKPYMQFDNAPNAVFRNWDRSGNYRITREAPQFDRSAEVLAP